MKSTRLNAPVIVLAAALIAPTLIVGAPVFAHHSGAMFEPVLQKELHGVIRQFRWSNPHAWIEIDVPGEAGATTMWAVEMTAPNNLMRTGWTRRTLKAGDEVILTIRPLRDGQPGGTFVRVTTLDGVEMPPPVAGAPSPGGTSTEASTTTDAPATPAATTESAPATTESPPTTETPAGDAPAEDGEN